MKKMLYFISAMLLLFGCAPVLSSQAMREAHRDVPLSQLRESPEAWKGRLFVLGGVIVETRVTEKGSLIEALAVGVDRYGYLEYDRPYKGRVLALFPKDKGLLDPVIYRKGREITFSGVFVELRKGRIDEMDYVYPVFEIAELYLWEEYRDYYSYPWYYRYPPWWYDPWWDTRWRPYPPPYAW